MIRRHVVEATKGKLRSAAADASIETKTKVGKWNKTRHTAAAKLLEVNYTLIH